MAPRSPGRILVAPQEYKETLSATQVARAMARALGRVWPLATLDLAPLGDGGPGTVDAFLAGLADGERRFSRVFDPLGREVEAAWAFFPSRQLAVVEMAAASGLWRVAPDERRVLESSTRGTGQLIRAALDAGATEVLVGAGGSATNDGGLGAAAELGLRFFDAQGAALEPRPKALGEARVIDTLGLDPRLVRGTLRVLTDVNNPLCGPEGAARIYGPQKGASHSEVEVLEQWLAQFAALVRRQLGTTLDEAPGAGAAGGLAFGLASLCRAELVPGFETIAAALGLDARIAQADLVLTGEGRYDTQTAYAKGPFALARLSRDKPVILFAGRLDSTSLGPFARLIEVTPRDQSATAVSQHAAAFVERAVEAWARDPR